ncbi:hypothetical protein DL96DRAFT_1595952 [Flagelloscypha sp. PMI_526]|nr:hypothetical protein DL96DRAFT_1595952 [Flagelloscypha sp. PMI_526]
MYSSQPILLPSELEDEIFAMAAKDLSSAFQLLQVSHRVYDRVLPDLYHTMDLERETYYPQILLFPNPGFEHTKRLILMQQLLKPGRVICEFPNTSHLLLWINPDTIRDHDEVTSAMEFLPLRWIAMIAPQYSSKFWMWDWGSEFQSRLLKGNHGWRTTLTHLSLDYNIYDVKMSFDQYPMLTHIIVHSLSTALLLQHPEFSKSVPSLLGRETFILYLLLCVTDDRTDSDEEEGSLKDTCKEVKEAVSQLGWDEKCLRKVVVSDDPLWETERNFWDCKEDFVRKAEQMAVERND